MDKTKTEFQTSIDILTSFIKETEDILVEEKEENKQDEIKQEEKINSNVTSKDVNDIERNGNEGCEGEFTALKQPDEKSSTNNDKRKSVPDQNIFVESEVDVKAEANSTPKSPNEEDKTEETNQLNPDEQKDEPNGIENHMLENEIDLPLPPPPEEKAEGKLPIGVAVEPVEADLPLPPDESADSSSASDESEKEK
jgi:hypothetical protein